MLENELVEYIQAAYPALAIRTAEEPRAMATIQTAAEQAKKNMFV